VAVLGTSAFTLALLVGALSAMEYLVVLQLTQVAVSLVSLAAAGFTVAAVVSNRDDDAPTGRAASTTPPLTQEPYPQPDQPQR
jgi:hypothetical protein